ncbi:hypothetical protein H5410_062690 [Solanum commersonii]|uniref:non-specific serine/threonine protein kinase n=1 Tax=Solanum commersonii TaxID=4109 RepID=A0A9J5WC90_SOLCO|nr:hypothetical protein H5410_062690 [Solanum commersonii]
MCTLHKFIKRKKIQENCISIYLMMVPKIVQFLVLLYLFTVTFASMEEAIALLKWKATFKIQTNSLLASWTQSSNACGNWYGVTCLNGRVSKLDIQGARVIGTLYDFPFSTLPFLEYVDLSVNNLSGTIPPEISNLTNLVYLDLHTNMISGTIPLQIGSLAKLQNINIYDNLLNGSIPASLSNLTNLSILSLYQNNLSGLIPTEIGYLRSLTSLDLGTNSLNGSIPTSLGNLTNLSSLFLNGNHLSGFIPALLGNLTSLSILYLQENNLSGSIPKEIGYLRSLSQLVLAKNSLSGAIPVSLGNLTSLSIMYLYQNNLSGSIPEEIGYLRTLSYLDFSTNFLSGSIPTSLGNLNELYLLSLFANNLSGSIPKTNNADYEPDGEESNSEFMNDFWKGTLMGYGSGLCIGLSIIYFMMSTGNLKWLARIIEGLEIIPYWLHGHKSSNACEDWYGVTCFNGRVKKLDIRGANVIGTLYDFPFSTLPFLEYVDLSMNNLSGVIPPHIGNLTNLVYLDLHTNHISGTIPPQIDS